MSPISPSIYLTMGAGIGRKISLPKTGSEASSCLSRVSKMPVLLPFSADFYCCPLHSYIMRAMMMQRLA